MTNYAKLTIFGKEYQTSRRTGLIIILAMLALAIPSFLYAMCLVLSAIAKLTGLHEILVAVLSLIFLGEVTSSVTGLMGNEIKQTHAILPKLIRQLIGFAMVAYTAWSLYADGRFIAFSFLVTISLAGYLSANPLLHIKGKSDH